MPEQHEQSMLMHRDQLKPEVGEYADNLNNQIKSIVKQSGFDDLETFLDKAEIEKLRLVNNLMSRLEAVAGTGEMPFDEKEFNLAFDNLLSFLDNYQNGANDQREKVICDKLAEMPHIPPPVLFNDRFFLDKLLKRTNKYSLPYTYDVGLLLSVVFNQVLDELKSEKEKESLVQQLDLTDRSGNIKYFFGYNLKGGCLVFVGDAGRGVGRGMTGGKIIAEVVGTHCGVKMKGGEINVISAGGYLGELMEGGTIRAKNAGVLMGYGSTGGKIYIEEGDGVIIQNCKAEVYLKGVRQN